MIRFRIQCSKLKHWIFASEMDRKFKPIQGYLVFFSNQQRNCCFCQIFNKLQLNEFIFVSTNIHFA
jgi:hypothetical protein